jgi:hypothetical protein
MAAAAMAAAMAAARGGDPGDGDGDVPDTDALPPGALGLGLGMGIGIGMSRGELTQALHVSHEELSTARAAHAALRRRHRELQRHVLATAAEHGCARAQQAVADGATALVQVRIHPYLGRYLSLSSPYLRHRPRAGACRTPSV